MGKEQFFVASSDLDDLERARADADMIYFAVPLWSSPGQAQVKAQACALSLISLATILTSAMGFEEEEAVTLVMGVSFAMTLRPGQKHGQALNEFQTILEAVQEWIEDPTKWALERGVTERVLKSFANNRT